ncbi:MAG: relaxase/mobilization nuclease domain-containing protein [bacterium]|nr:relaxase/mobilization nuclease domain-containing protein [bacterium]
MAYTKTHSITTTLKKAIDYILNPEKTDDELYVSSFACSSDTADIEFEWTRNKAKMDKGNSLARHLIQSFAPGETTPEQAHEIGLKLAEEVLGGKYEFVISTHTDKNSIHNHIIFNSVSFVDYKKYHSNKYTYRNIQRTSDRICKEYGLSVIVPNTDNRSKNTKYENKPTSWRAKLKTEIDKIIPQAKDFEDFLRLMELQGYDIKRGQYISVRAKGQERFIRLKAQTLGERYSIEGITKRIEKSRRRKPIIRDNRISLIIDIQNCIKAQESKGYEHWAKINNLKQASKTLNFLTEHNISSYAELESRIEEMRRNFDDTADKLKSTESRLNNINILRKNISTYRALRPIYEEYTKVKDKARFEKQHQREIILFKAAHKYLSETLTDGKLPALETVNTKRMELEEQKQKLYADYKTAKKELSEIDVVKANVDTMLNVPQKPEQTRENQIE